MLEVPSTTSKFRQSSDNKASPSSRRRPQQLIDVRRTRTSNNDDDDDDYDEDRRNYVPCRSKLQAAAAAALAEPHSPSISAKLSKRPAPGINGLAAGKPASLSPNMRHGFTFPPLGRSGRSAELDDDEYDADRPRSCDAVIPPTAKPILVVDRCHDCSMENVRSFVNGVELRRCGGPVAGGRTTGRSPEVLLGVETNDVADAAGRKCVRFAPVVRVCDQTSAISFRHLRHQSASSAPAALGGCGGGGSCSLPTLSLVGSVGCGSVSSRDDELDLPAVVERYMIRRERHIQDVDDTDSSRSDDVHRFPPLRRRRT